MLCCAVLAAGVPIAHAEELGIIRRVPAVQQPNQQILPYVVRVIAFDASGQSFGSGSYVGIYGEYGVILTNWHVVLESEGLVHVHFPSGFSSYGAVIKSDMDWDLALVAISRPPLSIPTLPIAQTPSKPGDPLWIVGFGSGSSPIAQKGQCVRYMTWKDESRTEIMEVSVSARKGDSGGPILNQKGELAGVLFGSDMVQNTAGTYCERVNRFLMETYNDMARLPERPETHFAAAEKNGPRHSLKESRNAVPQNAAQLGAPPRSDTGGTPAAVRSSSQRYVAPASGERPQTQVPQRGQNPPAAKLPLPSPIPEQGVEQTIWTKTSSNVVQTTQLVPLEADSVPIPIPVASQTATDRYRLKLAADRSNTSFAVFLSLNIFCAAGLVFCAVQLLGNPPTSAPAKSKQSLKFPQINADNECDAAHSPPHSGSYPAFHPDGRRRFDGGTDTSQRRIGIRSVAGAVNLFR